MPKLNGAGTAWIPQSWDTTGEAAQTATPLTGTTVNMIDSAADGYLSILGAGDLAALSINLPSNAASVLGEVRRINALHNITALTLNQIGGAATIQNTITTINAGDTVSFIKVAANTWSRLI